ncbi:hypothetical protein BpHYR1_030950 [Brachionus plicatilis]|uniref:Uncharacterized protein n=1 Tax=Brachionus plicatilis TaxID=10195 RepID=A0A3M7SVY7_BRAPC|nr:hypothetical protein BpHYR1_030950 [Brachionus plicatilis]
MNWELMVGVLTKLLSAEPASTEWLRVDERVVSADGLYLFVESRRLVLVNGLRGFFDGQNFQKFERLQRLHVVLDADVAQSVRLAVRPEAALQTLIGLYVELGNGHGQLVQIVRLVVGVAGSGALVRVVRLVIVGVVLVRRGHHRAGVGPQSFRLVQRLAKSAPFDSGRTVHLFADQVAHQTDVVVHKRTRGHRFGQEFVRCAQIGAR